ncbi:MAG: zinc-binding dehydrogenase [Mogibacterium sp.]|nr:zinc-binding dehydrogenase [Mogibacterium sp.]
MKNRIYSLTRPGTFEIIEEVINEDTDGVIVRPGYMSICRADQRYYQGTRAPEVLARKLPMALIHEAIGQVVSDRLGEYRPGDWVVMVPNTPVEEDDIVAENYLRSSKFRASGFDGFMQDYVVMGRDRLVKLPDNIDKEVAAFSELSSVAYHTINRFDAIAHRRRNTIGIWGDGNIAFLIAIILRYRFPESKIVILGIHEEKMSDFTFADRKIHTAAIPDSFRVDHAFECVGGKSSGVAINQIIDHINPEGTIALMGVSEDPIPVNTRMVLEKGLRLIGSSRSGIKDFRDLIDFYEAHPEVIPEMKKIIGDVVAVSTIEDMNKAFDLDKRRHSGKTVMVWGK